MELRFAEALAVARIKARIEKTDWSAGNALRKLNMQLLASLLLRGGPFFLLWQKRMNNIIVFFLFSFGLTQKKQKVKYQLSRSEQIFSWTDLRKGCKELTNDKRFSGSVNHSKKPVRLWRMLFLTFVIDTLVPLHEIKFILRTSVM